MMTKQRLPIPILAMLLFALIVPAAVAAPPASPAPAPTSPKGTKAGSITALLPVARIVRGAGRSATTTDAKKGDEIIWNDLIKTERGGRARITLNDQSILSLGSQSDLRIVKHDARSQQTALTMAYGRVRAEVAKVTRQGGSFELRTPTAVAGVIGTDFGVDSEPASGSTFVCISGLVQVSNSDPNIAGSVQCAPGMTTTVTPGKAPTIPVNATPEQIQQLIQDTEPAIISAMSPLSALPGATFDATLTGTKMGSVTSASAFASGSTPTGMTISLGTVSDTSVTVHVVIAADAAPGPRTIHLGKSNGADSAAVFTILAPPNAAQGQDIGKQYLALFNTEGQTTSGGLSSYLATLQQTAGQALQQLQQLNADSNTLNSANSQFTSQVNSVQNAINAAAQQINNAVAQAAASFQSQYETANQALLQRSPSGTPDDLFNQQVKTAFDSTNNALGQTFKTILANLETTVAAANTSIAQAQQTFAAGIVGKPCDPGQICPAVNTTEKSVDVGAELGGPGVSVLDASSSKPSTGGSIVSYQWVLCDPSYKPAQTGVALPGATTAGCNAITGYQSASSEFQFPTCNLQPNDYVARVKITDTNNQSAAMDVKLHILAPAYDDPSTVVRDLAQAYSNLQSTSFLNLFDQSGFSGFTALSENIRNTFPTLASMSINPRVSQAAITCNDATVRADWVQNYTYKTNPSITFSQSEQLSMRMTRTPGKGWLITDFQGDNGTVQGQLPGPAQTSTPQPDLQINSGDVFPGTTPGGLVVATGSQVFSAIVQNVGGADFTANTVVQFQLLSGTTTVVQTTVPLTVPLAAGNSETVQATMNVPTSLAPGTQVSILATANPPGSSAPPEASTSNNTASSAQLTIGGGDLQVTSAYLTSAGAPNTSPIPVAAGPYNFTAVVANKGTSNFLGSTVLRFSISSSPVASVDVPLGVTTLVPGATVTVSGTVNVANVPGTQLTMTANVNPGCTAAETSCGAENFFTQTLAVQPLVTESASPVMQAGGATASALTLTAFKAETVTLVPPTGIGAGAQGLTQTLAAGGSFTWNLTATLSANGTDAMTVLVTVPTDTAGPYSMALGYTVTPPSFAQTAIPSLLAGGAPGALTVTVNVPGSYMLVLPAGVTTTSTNPQIITSPTGGTLSWNIATGFTAATGSNLTANIVGGVYTFPALYNNAGQANYTVTSVVFTGHTAPFTGANALQVGETNASLTVVVQNVGNGSPAGNITLTATCTPNNTSDTTSCQGGNNPTGTITAPATGQSVTTVLPLGSVNNMIPGSFTGTVTMSTTLPQSSTADDTATIPFDVSDFVVTVQNPLSPQYLMPGTTQNFTVSVQVLGTTSFAVPVSLSFASGGSGITFAPASASVSGTQVFSVVADSTTPLGAVAVLATGTNRGASHPAAQAFVVIVPTFTLNNLFVNDASNPLQVPVGSTTAQQVSMSITGSAFSGAASIVLPTAAGFSINTDATAGAVYNSPFNVSFLATASSPAAIPVAITAQLPNTSPVLSISKTLYIIGTGVPDLSVVSATPSANFGAAPWIDGEGVDFTVVVQNVGNAPTYGGEKVKVELSGVAVGSNNLSPTPMAAGASQTIVIHAVAPDIHGNTAYGPTNVSGRIHIEPANDVLNLGGEANYANNSLAISVPMANWHIAVNGAGAQSTPLQITLPPNGSGSGQVVFSGVVDGGYGFSPYSSLTFQEGQGQTGTSFSVTNFGNDSTTCGTTPPANTMFCATVGSSSTTIQAGIYYAQAVATLTDPGSGQQTVRQATVAVQVGRGSNPAVPCLTSSANNITSQDSNCPATIPTTLEINGGLSEQFSVTMSMICGLPTAPVACSGHADLAIQDASNTTTTAGGLNDVATGEIVPVRVAAIMDANGNVTTGMNPYVIGINGVQQPGMRRGGASSPDAVGAKVNLAVQVGDIDVTATNGTQTNGGWCGGVAPGGPGLPVTITWNLTGGFNASVQWEIEDKNHAPVGAVDFSFSAASGSGTGSISETITNTSTTPITLDKYFLAATISNGTATATKYFPFFLDGSTAQNFCGAVSAARGTARVSGTWSRSVADSLGPMGGGVAVSAANTGAAGVDLHFVTSGISYSPSIPKAGDTLQVRFAVRNSGTGNAVGVPIALQVNGATVASDTFDVAAGQSTVGGLSWKVVAPASDAVTERASQVRTTKGRFIDTDVSAGMPASLVPLNATLVVDPNHITRQASTLDKTAQLAHLSVRPSQTANTQLTGPSQRMLLELEDGACAGVRLSSGGMGPCGNADLEVTVADLSKSQLGLETLAGICDIGTSFEMAAGSRPSYSQQAAGLAGHTYSVRLPDGSTETVTIDSVRNPAELDAKARALFRANATRILKSLGDSSGAAAPGDLTGVDSRATVFITFTVRQN